MKHACLILLFMFSGASAVAAEDAAIDVSYEAAPNLDLDTNWLDPNELVKILSYDVALHTYEVTKVEDPTVVRIFTTPAHLAKAVPGLNLEVLKRSPATIVGRTFELDHELILED